MHRITSLFTIAFLLVACGKGPSDVPAAADVDPSAVKISAPLISRDLIFGNPDRTVARISPDGAHVSWLAPKNGVMNVWVAPADDPDRASAITNDTHRGIRTYSWAPNSRFIYFVQDKGGDENFHVYSSNIASGEVRDLTPIADGARATIQQVSSQRPDHIVVGVNERDPQIFDLYLVDVTTGKRELLKENPGYAGWLIDNLLEPRYGIQPTPEGGADIVDFDGQVLMPIPPEDFITMQSIGFDQQNAALYMIDSRGRNTAALAKFDIASGKTTFLAEDDKADVANVLIDPQTLEPVAYSVNYLKSSWFGLNDSISAELDKISSALRGSLQIVSTTDDLSKWVVYDDATDRSGAYYLYDRDGGSVTEMVVTRPGLRDATLAPMHAIEIPARDGLTLVSYLTLPVQSDTDGDGRPGKPLPMVLAVHGGPWARDNYGYHSWHQWLANRGYAVLSVNYRGSTGFGKTFTRAAIKEFAGKMHDDLIDGVNWAIDNGIADKDKIAIAGGSYGGYATLIGVSFTPETFACGVDIVGPSSLVTLIESFPEYWKPSLAGTWYTYVGDPAKDEEREDMLSRSAISRIDDISVPLLVGQGENDPRVTKLESDQLVEAMSSNELPVTYVNFPDEGHGFQRPENRLAFYAVMEGFLAQCLGGKAEDVRDAFDGSSIEILYGRGYVSNLPTESATAE